MSTLDEILLVLGQIQGELIEIRKLSQRVSQLELWQSRLKGMWVGLVGAFAYLFKVTR